MPKYILSVVFCLLLIFPVFSQNHMDIMTAMTGEFDYAHMGWIMTTLDWNGDGYDDLIVDSNNWKPPELQSNPNIMPFGQFYIYFGGPNFDNVPEMLIPGNYESEYSHTFSMCNAGDMNGDGIDDLALFRATRYEDNDHQHHDLQLCVFYGGETPDAIPDYVLTFPREQWKNGGGSLQNLGDINGDQFDDLGYIMIRNINQAPNTFGIIYGGNMVNTVLMESGTSWDSSNICGIGDVNADGIEDFSISYKYIIDNNNERYSKVVVYSGSMTGVYSDSLVICEGLNFNICVFPAGDVNGDGYADFVSSFSGNGAKLYFGEPDFDNSHYVVLNPPYSGGNWENGFGHGDVNGNGKDDLMGTNVSQSNGYGDAYLWIGGNTMNGGQDLHITPPPPTADDEMFGFCLTMGDYNGDGCCDAAISAPMDNGSGAGIPGRVFIYAGNPQLNDPTPNTDETEVPIISKLQLYPNPLQPQQSNLNIRFTPRLTPDPSLACKRGEINPLTPSSRGVFSPTFEIFNIRGQKVKSFIISAELVKSGSANYNLNDLSTGVYVCVFSNGEMQHKGKITIIK